MRDRDRWWWSLLLVGLAFGACGVAAPYFGVRSIPTDDPYITSAYYWQLIGLVGLLTLVCLGGGLLFIFTAIHARRRHRKRLAAPIFISSQPSAEDMIYGTLPQPISVTEIILRIAGKGEIY